MFLTVRDKIDQLIRDGYVTKYETAQLVWERMRMEEQILFKKFAAGKLIAQVLGRPDKLGAYFETIPLEDDYCRFHENPV